MLVAVGIVTRRVFPFARPIRAPHDFADWDIFLWQRRRLARRRDGGFREIVERGAGLGEIIKLALLLHQIRERLRCVLANKVVSFDGSGEDLVGGMLTESSNLLHHLVTCSVDSRLKTHANCKKFNPTTSLFGPSKCPTMSSAFAASLRLRRRSHGRL